MTGSLRSLRWRTAVSIAGVFFVLLWLFTASGGGAYIIQVDYTWAGATLDGAQVMIGDSVVGTLEPRPGSQRVNGFVVEPGEYELRVRTDGCEGIPKTVALARGESRRAVVMADVEEGHTCRIRLW